MRPVYENSATKSKELAFAEFLSWQWSCDCIKLSLKYQLDFACMRDGKVVSWLELKCRNNHFWKYPTYMVSLDKWLKAIQLSEITGIPAFLAVRFTDADGYMRMGRGVGTIGYGGRSDRGDAMDLEPMVFISMEQFKNVERKNYA